MAMETRMEAPARGDMRDRDSRVGTEVINRFYEGRMGGVGLYSEVRPRREDRVIVQKSGDF